MLIRKVSYFDQFRCIADRCPDSCCKEWSVSVDPEAAAHYRALPGALGDRLRQVLTEEDGDTILQIENGRCPMWRADGLCRIQAELGADALCRTCREFPRLRHDYGSFLEQTLELSCPEAARLILSAPPAPMIALEADGGEEPEYDGDAMEVLLRTREQALAIVSDPGKPVNLRLALLLLYGYQAQGELDGGEAMAFEPESALASAADFAKGPAPGEIVEFFRNLEILTDVWQNRLQSPAPGPWQEGFAALARYFVERYWLQAVSDYDLTCRVKFGIIACLLIRQLGGDFVQTAQLFSKEIENNPENVEAILDGAYSHPAFTDDKLLGALLG